MLGDAGANAYGALIGLAIATRHRPVATRGDRSPGSVALTAASEKVSFTKVIEATPVLREIDALGRRSAVRDTGGAADGWPDRRWSGCRAADPRLRCGRCRPIRRSGRTPSGRSRAGRSRAGRSRGGRCARPGRSARSAARRSAGSEPPDPDAPVLVTTTSFTSPGVRRLAGAAALIAGLTIASRLLGFVRTLVLGKVAIAELSTAYLTANLIPNIIFEIVAGGALASLVVPLVAGAIARRDRATVGATASALMTWVLIILVPLAVLVAVFAEPIVSVLLGAVGGDRTATVAVGTRMLRIFAPQIPLYGIGIVLSGLLQGYRRFAWPVLAPLLSSVVVIATYVAYGLAEPSVATIAEVSTRGQLILAIGTTLGVVVLSLSLVLPVRGLAAAMAADRAFRQRGPAQRVRTGRGRCRDGDRAAADSRARHPPREQRHAARLHLRVHSRPDRLSGAVERVRATGRDIGLPGPRDGVRDRRRADLPPYVRRRDPQRGPALSTRRGRHDRHRRTDRPVVRRDREPDPAGSVDARRRDHRVRARPRRLRPLRAAFAHTVRARPEPLRRRRHPRRLDHRRGRVGPPVDRVRAGRPDHRARRGQQRGHGRARGRTHRHDRSAGRA